MAPDVNLSRFFKGNLLETSGLANPLNLLEENDGVGRGGAV